tara:strand:- start:1023 stop:1670 length:648 start_codon:yes stop_codon:yes gene_type:complete
MKTIDVLDKGFVRLVDSMGSDLSVVNAARISYNRASEEMNDKDLKLLKYLWDNKHTSPFRHAFVQIHIKAPLFVLRQWQKHQIGCSWNEMSGRYVQMKEEFYNPLIWRKQHDSNKQSSSGQIDDQMYADDEYYDAITCCVDVYRNLLNAGVAREQARLVLPVSLYSECIWTCSLQALMHFLKERMHQSAQLEIQCYARAVLDLTSSLFHHCLQLK